MQKVKHNYYIHVVIVRNNRNLVGKNLLLKYLIMNTLRANLIMWNMEMKIKRLATKFQISEEDREQQWFPNCFI